MAKIYMKQGNEDETVKCLVKAANQIITYSNWSEETHKSLLVNMGSIKTYMHGVNHARRTKEFIEKEPFESIQKREEIINILAELDKYAN